MTDKAFWAGTHRLCSPAETWDRIQPVLDRVGITRVADLTWLDEVGIPVFHAVRPLSTTVAVSQGKGISPIAAKVSAVMESIELWHVETPPLPRQRASVCEVRPELCYAVEKLPRPHGGWLTESMTMDWCSADVLGTARSTLVPFDVLDLNSQVRAEWCPPTFSASSNGLASGNSVDEATLHALYEVVERDALADWHTRHYADWDLIDPTSVSGTSGVVLEQYWAAGTRVLIGDMTGRTGIPTFAAVIWSETYPAAVRGSGAHLDPDVALSRALTEAAQARITMIVGAREDIPEQVWQVLYAAEAGREFAQLQCVGRSLEPPRLPAGASLSLDLRTVLAVVDKSFGQALRVDLTRPDVGVSVVRVLVPGARCREA